MKKENSLAMQDIISKETNSSYLATRLNINEKYQSNDFGTWLFNHLDTPIDGAVLDIGCGTGKQTIPFAQSIGPKGHVYAFDISAESIKALKVEAAHQNLGNITAVIGAMEDIAQLLEDFQASTFDIIHSSYALYYAKNPKETLEIALKKLKSGGQAAVFTPVAPHGMVNFAKSFHAIPAPVEDCFLFGPEVMEPFFHEHLENVQFHLYENIMQITDANDFMALYRATTYYDAAYDEKIFQEVSSIIEQNGAFKFEKNGFLVTGRKR